jgi:hypothetical protein
MIVLWSGWSGPKFVHLFKKCVPLVGNSFSNYSKTRNPTQENSSLVKMATLVFNPTQRLLKVADILRYVCMLTCFTDAPTMNMDGSNVHAV